MEAFFGTVLEVCQSEKDFSSAGKVIYYTQYFCYPLEDQNKADFNPFDVKDEEIPDETEEVDLGSNGTPREVPCYARLHPGLLG